MLIRKVILSMTLLLLSQAAMADFYVGGNIGSAHTDDPAGGVNDSDLGLKVYIGGEINQYFAIEGYFADFGQPADTTGFFTTEISGIGVDVLGKIQVGSRSRIFGSVGFFSWDEDYKADGFTIYNDSGTDIKLGVGYQHNFTERLSLRVEYEHFLIGDQIEDIDVDMFSAGVQFNF